MQANFQMVQNDRVKVNTDLSPIAMESDYDDEENFSKRPVADMPNRRVFWSCVLFPGFRISNEFSWRRPSLKKEVT